MENYEGRPPTDVGKRAVKACQGALNLADKFLEDSEFEQQQGERLEPLQAAVSRMFDLAQLVEGFEVEPCKAELQEISRELQGEKSKVQEIAQLLFCSKDPLIAEKAFKVMQEIEEALH